MTPGERLKLATEYAADARKRLHDVLTSRGLALADFSPTEREQLYAAATTWVMNRRGDPTIRPN